MIAQLPLESWISTPLVREPSSYAVFSPCRTWRYLLVREFDTGEGTANFIMLNPSTATETINDPTIIRCINYAKAWGFGRLVVTNIFAYRATAPRDMKAAADPSGPQNDKHIIEQASGADLVVCAWGVHGEFMDREAHVRRLLRYCGRKVRHLGLTKGGHPKHPLYQRADAKPITWSQE